jgi:hypothetical protein
VRFYDYYRATVTVQRPDYYLIPQAWSELIMRMKLNKVNMTQLASDSIIEAEVLYIEKHKSSSSPYEGHYINTVLQLRRQIEKVKVFKGDYLIPVNQPCNRYIVETLEPQGVDSWFTWGLFDAILQQKEWFSSYVFEDLADSLLKSNRKLHSDFILKKETDSLFAKDSFAQLYYIYQHSPYFEKTYRRYPVLRVNTK